MEAIRDFEDILVLLKKYKVQYLIIGDLAFIYHAKPRYANDMDLWINPHPGNIALANLALTEFGSPVFLEQDDYDQIVQIGIAPNRVDLILKVPGMRFQTAWNKRIRGRYGSAGVYWIDLESLIRIKQRIDNPRHQDDVRVLRDVKRLKKRR